MRTPYSLILYSLIGFALYRVFTRIVKRTRQTSAAKRLGCGDAPKEPSHDPLNITTLRSIYKANREGKLPSMWAGRYTTVGEQEQRPVMTFKTHVFRDWLFMTCDPKNIQAMLATQFKDFCLGSIRSGVFEPLLGNGIFSVDGAKWEHSRSLLRPQFSRDQVSDLDLEERHLQNMLQALPVSSLSWTETTDLLPLFFRLTIDSASEFLFGESVNSQLSALAGSGYSASADDAAFVSAFENSQDTMAKSLRLNEWYSLGRTKEFYADCATCHAYIGRTVARALARKNRGDGDSKASSGDEKERYVFLDSLAAATSNPTEIRDQMLSIMVAGRDTTASLLSFLFLLLSQHPRIFAHLRATVVSTFGTYSAPRNLTFSALKNCSYLQWCLSETLRLYPTVPINSRRSAVDTTLPRGGGKDGSKPVFVPKGTEVNYSVYAMHRRPEIWGEDAAVFKPERWEGRRAGFEFLPFNGGPRICLGQQFALTEAGYITVRLLQRFDQIDGGAMKGLENDWYLTLTGRPKYGVKLRLHAASE